MTNQYLDEMQNATEQFLALLHDRQPGLLSWQDMLRQARLDLLKTLDAVPMKVEIGG